MQPPAESTSAFVTERRQRRIYSPLLDTKEKERERNQELTWKHQISLLNILLLQSLSPPFLSSSPEYNRPSSLGQNVDEEVH